MLGKGEEKLQVTEEVEEQDGALPEDWRREEKISLLSQFLDLFRIIIQVRRTVANTVWDKVNREKSFRSIW
jgi:hypothetical protein